MLMRANSNSPCSTGQVCKGGVCSCTGEESLCGASCSNLATDNGNCGACGTVCSGSTSCQSGACECDSGLSECSDGCVDQQTDSNNCGECGNVCAGFEQCVQGICKYDGDQCGGDAREIGINRIALYQAVEVDLFANGTLVSTNQRSVDLVQGREALMRVFVNPESSFSPRELSARLFVDNGEEIQVFFHKRTVSGASIQSNLDSTFQIKIPADVMGAETKYWVELAECGPAQTGSVGTIRFPKEESSLGLVTI